MLFKSLAVATMATAAAAANATLCDKYTTALLKDNNATNQETLLTLVVNTAVIGNYTKPNVGIAVPGILTKGMYKNTTVDLLPYFNGDLKSSNRGGSSGVSINFLDDGGAVPLMMNKPANGTGSAQYLLLTHLYQYFGALLGCNAENYPAYAGEASMYEVHKFMDLSAAEVGYFITQVGLSAASFGVSSDDVTTVGTALETLFDVRCAPATTVIPAQGAQLNSICIDSSCPLAPNDTCAAYNGTEMKPSPVSSSAMGSATGSATGSSTGSSTSSSATSKMSSAAVPAMEMSFVAVVGGLFAALL